VPQLRAEQLVARTALFIELRQHQVVDDHVRRSRTGRLGALRLAHRA
jgi:hypothetical protein